MSRKLFRKYAYDISLDDGVGSHLVIGVTGLMVFFVTLALAVNFALSAVSKTWVTGLSGTLTVEIKPPLSTDGGQPSVPNMKRFEDSVGRVMALLEDSPDISEARLLPEAEIRQLIEPWVGHGVALDSIPLPALIDIKLAPDADVTNIQSALRNIEPAATVDSHTDTLDDVKMLARAANLFMLLLTGVIIALAIAAISGIVRSKLLIHQTEVETIHLIGASDEYIAHQFRQHTLRGTLKGALLGLFCAAAVLLAIAGITHALESNIFPDLRLLPAQWGVLLVLPVLTATLIAHLTAQAAVLKELSRLP